MISGGTALRESITVDEVAHIGAGLSYLQRLDMRLNAEHPPLGKIIAAIPLAIGGTRADYSSNAWKLADTFFPAYMTQWTFGDAVVGRWNAWRPTLLWARLPMLLLTVALGWLIYLYGMRLGGDLGGLLCLALYVTTPSVLVFGPLVITDLPVTLFSLLTLWELGNVWRDPSPQNTLRFGLALAAALLSKYTALLFLIVIPVLFVHSKFWCAAGEPLEPDARKMWRRRRWGSVLRGVFYAFAIVFAAYVVLSWNQPNDALDRIAGGWWAAPLRRLLMPIWLYARGLLLMLVMGSRPTYLLGHSYSHGVPFYFPVAFVLKSTLGFVLLLILAGAASLTYRRMAGGKTLVPSAYQDQRRVLTVGFWVFLAACLASRLDISIRHFMMPMVLLMLLLAPLPKMLEALPGRTYWRLAAGAMVLASFWAVLATYPNLFPFVNTLAFGRPAYRLLNDSNVSWNGALPAVETFIQQHRLHRMALDWASLSDPQIVVPEAEAWDCQEPSAADARQWVAVTAVSIVENRPCAWLEHYPHQALAGGEFYAFQMPPVIPQPGTPNGPPSKSQRRMMWGMPFDIRGFCVDLERHPEKLPAAITSLVASFQQQNSNSKINH